MLQAAKCCVLHAIPLVLSQTWCLTTGVTSMEAQPQRSEQANRYAEVVRAVNKALVSGSQDQFDAVNAFLAACPEEDNGQLHHDLSQTLIAPCSDWYARCQYTLFPPPPNGCIVATGKFGKAVCHHVQHIPCILQSEKSHISLSWLLLEAQSVVSLIDTSAGLTSSSNWDVT